MSWSTIKGQKDALKIIKSSLGRRETVHSYLFYGPPGVGKKQAAVYFAKSLFCSQDEPGKWCNQCSTCRSLDEDNHPDLGWVRISDGDNKKSIGIDMIRNLKLAAGYYPYEKGHKVYIIEEADRMTEAAQNSLLKLLEEPPDFVKLILISPNLQSLLPTIRSRCQIIKFRPLSREEIHQLLTETRPGYTEKEYRSAAASADGSYESAVEILTSDEHEDSSQVFREQICELLSVFPVSNSLKAWQAAAEFDNYRDRLDEFFHFALNWFRDLLLVKENDAELKERAETKVEEYFVQNGIINRDYLSELTAMSSKYTVDDICRIMNNIDKLRGYNRQNVNSQLLFELLIIDLEDRGK